MFRISDSIKEIIDGNQFLKMGLQQNLLNLSAVAEYLKPLIESRTKKSVNKSAVLINLSRINRQVKKWPLNKEEFRVNNIIIRSGLTAVTYYRTHEILEKLKLLYSKIEKKNAYITLNQGTNEVSLIVDETIYCEVSGVIAQEPKVVENGLSALGIHFDERYLKIPGLIYYIIQQITMQNINIVEISSTNTELIIYVHDHDVELAFETIYRQFAR